MIFTKIEHIALYVKDLERAKNFFAVYFDGKPGDKYINPNTGFSSYFLTFDDGARLELMNDALTVGECADCGHIGYAHLAFCVGTKEKVDALTGQLRTDGYRVLGEPRTTGDGYYESCIADAEGNRIEITI